MPAKSRKKRDRSLKNCTMMISKETTILVKKYSRLENVKGDHLDINFDQLMQPPKDVSMTDWLIINLVDFLERVELLYSSCSLFCTADTCPMFNAGPHYQYFWEDDDSPQPIQVSAPEYFANLKRYIKRNLQNKALFPEQDNAKLSEEATDVLKTSYRRIFRILAHLYMCHFSNINNIQEINVVEIMNTILAHYTRLALNMQMIEMSDIEMLAPVFTAINSQSKTRLCPTFMGTKT
ncbi:Mob1/phocein family protein [Tritrichomonas foetus]|uniref:Mob1/phocein family protein n=1 Tax=Tritrichomonas foetus TaxID=1144522 RepID=A0A1J4KQ71_9EUKA|nr:Mob1/phocein family protein [Tritrichomonas foetus]|eukprot:OHT13056.1 Mob1/phocein family protein [Tritrichomonas foetus]